MSAAVEIFHEEQLTRTAPASATLPFESVNLSTIRPEFAGLRHVFAAGYEAPQPISTRPGPGFLHIQIDHFPALIYP